MSEIVKITSEELINWLLKNAGKRAGISAANGIISIFDPETGETISTLNVDNYIINNSITINFIGPTQNDVAEKFFVDLIDGGLDQTIEGRLQDLECKVEIGDFNPITKTQTFITK